MKLRKEDKENIKKLTATQTTVALILLRESGSNRAKAFINHCIEREGKT